MIDDHDSCEWVNVSSGIGSLGCSGQSPERRKMVMCVCVCVRKQSIRISVLFPHRGSKTAHIDMNKEIASLSQYVLVECDLYVIEL